MHQPRASDSSPSEFDKIFVAWVVSRALPKRDMTWAANILSKLLGEHPEGLWEAELAGEECGEGDTSGVAWGLARGLGMGMPADGDGRTGGGT